MSIEKVLLESGNGVLRVTSQRVMFDSKQSSSSKYQCIPIDAVAAYGMVTVSSPAYLVAAAIMAVVTLLGSDSLSIWHVFIGFGIAAGLVAAYAATRRAVITVSPNGGDPIIVAVAGMKRDEVRKALDAIHLARLAAISGPA